MLVDSRLRLYAKDSDQGCNSGKNQISILPPFNIEDYLPFYTDKFIIIFFFFPFCAIYTTFFVFCYCILPYVYWLYIPIVFVEFIIDKNI